MADLKVLLQECPYVIGYGGLGDPRDYVRAAQWLEERLKPRKVTEAMREAGIAELEKEDLWNNEWPFNRSPADIVDIVICGMHAALDAEGERG